MKFKRRAGWLAVQNIAVTTTKGGLGCSFKGTCKCIFIREIRQICLSNFIFECANIQNNLTLHCHCRPMWSLLVCFFWFYSRHCCEFFRRPWAGLADGHRGLLPSNISFDFFELDIGNNNSKYFKLILSIGIWRTRCPSERLSHGWRKYRTTVSAATTTNKKPTPR